MRLPSLSFLFPTTLLCGSLMAAAGTVDQEKNLRLIGPFKSISKTKQSSNFGMTCARLVQLKERERKTPTKSTPVQVR